VLGDNLNDEGFAFLYCSRNEGERQSPLSVLRSFVRQLSATMRGSDSIQTCIHEYYYKCREKGSQPTITDCKKLISQLVNIYPRTTLILDALDEVDRSQRVVLIDFFDDLVARASKPVKVFISSRPEGDLNERFKDGANIRIQATDNDHDISRFIEKEVGNHLRWKKNMPHDLIAEVIIIIQDKSQGM